MNPVEEIPVEKPMEESVAKPASMLAQASKPSSRLEPASASEKLQPPFFVDLSTTLKQMMQAERAHKISSLKIA